MKARIKNYLSLTKNEWNGMVVLIVLIVLVLIAPYAYQWFTKDNTINPNELKAALVQMNKLPRADKNTDKTPKKPFKFDPNNLPREQWQQLGLSEKQINTIKNFEAKGGSFRKPADLKKIYGITTADYSRLLPYVTINARTFKPAESRGVVELNSADSAKLTTIEGIGPAFAKRIVYYRERLGGFNNEEQLKEVFGLDELKYNEIKSQVRVDATLIRKIDINTITFDKLRLMPYLDYKQVNAVIEYRSQHGKYNSIADLRNIAIIDEGILRKLEPYISFK